MSTRQENSRPQATKRKTVRPALIASEHTVSEYSLFLKHLLVGLADESVSAALVCPPGCDVDSVVPVGVEVVGYPAFNLPLLWYQNKRILVERLEKFNPTILHCLCPEKAILTRHLARQLNLPYILTINSLQNRWLRFFVSPKHLAKIIVPAESLAVNLAKVCPAFIERIEQINIGTFVSQGLACFHQDGRVTSMITAHPLKNVTDFENLLGAVRRLAIDGYEFMLVMIGSGRAERGLRKLLGSLGLSQIAIIVPELKNWPSVLAAGDIFIQPAVAAAFNPLLLEAMSAGSAVAACKGGIDDLIIEDKTAVVFDPHDELSIYGSLQRLFNQPESARQMAKAAQEHLRENHSVSKMVADTLRTYHKSQNWYESQRSD